MSDEGPSLFELFRGEVEENCRALSDGLLAIEKAGLSREGAEPLMRAAHSIKGAARVLGFQPVVAFAHQMEEVLDRYRKGQEPVRRSRIDQLLRATDLLAQLGTGTEQDATQWGERCAAEVNALLTELAAAAPEDPPSAAEAVESRGAKDAAGPEGSASAPAAPAASAASPSAPPSPPEPSSASAQAPERASPEGTLATSSATEATSGGAARTASLVSGSPTQVDVGGAKTAEGETRVVRVGAEHLDRMMRLAGESMVEARRAPTLRADVSALKERMLALRSLARRTGGAASLEQSLALAAQVDELHALLRRHGESLEELFRRSEEAATALYHEVLASRMRPFSEVTSGYPRMIRDLARQLGKEVEFEVIGGATPVDRDILSKLDAPITHMLRNAVDHGIEAPADRRAAGKRAAARIQLEARHLAGSLIVEIRDDGRGVDAAAIRRRAIERGLVGAEMAESLSRNEIHDFLFLPGFTTARAVTEVSGRGVGLDVVQRMVQAASGTISVRSEPGAGTAFVLRLPITLSVIRAALVEIAGDSYAVPLARLERILRVPPERLHPIEGRLQFELDGRSIGMIQAHRVLEVEGEAEPTESSSVLVIEQDHQSFGLVVDRFLGEQDLVVRPLDPRLGRVPHVSAAALLDDGSVTIILDVEDLLASVRRSLGEGRVRELGAVDAPAVDIRRRRRVLVVDDSITVREVQRQLLQRLGYEVETAVDGADGWNQLRAGTFDLLITDVDMPRLNGIELVRLVRREPRFTSLPVAIVSYKDREEDRMAGLEAGANAYLTKGSFKDESFASTIQRLVGASHE